MGSCNIDHSYQDVVKKLENQKEFLPADLYEQVSRFLDNEHSQETLNELFHLLKKYDLASKTEQEDRDRKLIALIV
ncbi:group-specific protein [Lentibacillus sp. Marseille-P4043]|uniref:group-specific protein n=1 Tax=Lentibacillus sp. Marseille-P4043 TaxID=2040293 RepID=UPI000D0AEA35|nr:group-specific protein [Lentibacillus sp. Marseille-P4043]